MTGEVRGNTGDELDVRRDDAWYLFSKEEKYAMLEGATNVGTTKAGASRRCDCKEAVVVFCGGEIVCA